VVLLLPKIEAFLIAKSRNMDFYVELSSMEGIHQVIASLKGQNIQIYDVDIERGKKSPNAVFSVRLNKHQSHAKIIAALSKLECISTIKEI